MLKTGGSGTGTAAASGEIAFELNGCHASVARFSYDPSGMSFAPRA